MENWKQVPGFSEYEVSDLGRVRSKPRTIVYKKGKNEHHMFCEGRILKPHQCIIKGKPFYPLVHLCRYDENGKREHIVLSMHTIVLTAFIGPRPEGMVARHFPDRNPNNNRLDNLQWGTFSQNQQDRIIHGTGNDGENQKNSKLTNEIIFLIRKEYQLGRWYPGKLTRKELAARYGVSKKTVDDILNRKTWKHV